MPPVCRRGREAVEVALSAARPSSSAGPAHPSTPAFSRAAAASAARRRSRRALIIASMSTAGVGGVGAGAGFGSSGGSMGGAARGVWGRAAMMGRARGRLRRGEPAGRAPPRERAARSRLLDCIVTDHRAGHAAEAQVRVWPVRRKQEERRVHEHRQHERDAAMRRGTASRRLSPSQHDHVPRDGDRDADQVSACQWKPSKAAEITSATIGTMTPM